MYSAEREKIDFTKFINPVGKNVEDWMTECNYYYYFKIYIINFSGKLNENNN